VVAIVNDPCYRVTLLASSVDRLNCVAAIRLRLACESGTSIIGNEFVTELETHADIEN
jgi:hypothetical protein